MKRIATICITVLLALTLCACSGGQKNDSNKVDDNTNERNSDTVKDTSDITNDNTNDNKKETGFRIPVGADEIGQYIYYYGLYELAGDSGEGLTPREGADLVVTDVLAPMGFLDTINPLTECVYIAFEDLITLDSAMGRECYIYTVAVGTVEGGFKGDNYQVVYCASVDYSGDKTAAIYEDFSDNRQGEGRGDIIEDIIQPEWMGMYKNDELGFSIEITDYSETDFWIRIYLLRNGSEVLAGTANISGTEAFTAQFNDIRILLYGDSGAIELYAENSPEWEHLGGLYIKNE